MPPECAEPLVPEIADLRKRAYLVALVVTCGQRGKAAEAAGVSRWTVRRWKSGLDGRPPDPIYLEALAVAEELAAQRMEDIAIERATEGLKSYKFDSKGQPLRHPKLCECGHSKVQHVEYGPCTEPECGCGEFVGEPYYELEFSDKLIQFLLKGELPDKYGQRIELRGMLANLDMSRLPDEIVGRLAAGEDAIQVLSTLAASQLRLLTAGHVAEEGATDQPSSINDTPGPP